ncbi:hypothetical protein [Streptomyces sp. JH34]|uniref:hypothetical protein n=1 Tax=Streptomyces sp. JH34 TaxID=2793633 RepID=UPI0023F95300|nr:hypothetical protein [Streptomyces sp. JH34]MDF6021270.1 hypothetical protein [Streptomyces sp. JH34]
MRWLVLYARSRQVPASAAAVLAAALAMWILARGEGTDPRLPVLALTAAVTAASIGLGGQDSALDRTAAVRWRPRRAVHVLLIGAVVASVLLAVRAMGADVGTTAFVVRDSAGLAGLAAVGAVLCGAQHAWTLPVGWLTLALFPATLPEGVHEILAWLLLPPGTAAATWVAVTLAVTGIVAYAVVGPRR